MDTRVIGRLRRSAVGIGGNNIVQRVDHARANAVVVAALDANVTYFDTAGDYGNGQSETFLRRALGSWRKEAITPKFGQTNSLQSGRRRTNWRAR